MAEDNRNNSQREESPGGRQTKTKENRAPKGTPRTAETGAANNGGQTQRASDKQKKQKHGGR